MIFATTCTIEGQGRARPIDPGRDMGPIADVIEAAFGHELDQARNSLVADMRSLAALGPLLTVVERVTPLASGYVWEQDRQVVGNVSVAEEDPVERRWFVSNVAVHPERQGRGIGRQLMEATLQGIRCRGGRHVLLQVRSDNEPAQRLYRRLGFRRFDTTVEMARPGSLPTLARPHTYLRSLGHEDWRALLDLARAATPPGVQQVRTLRERAFRPTLGRRMREWVNSLLGGRQTLRWGLERGQALVAVVSIIVQDGRAPAQLDLAVRPGQRGPLELSLADHGLAALRAYSPRAVTASISTGHLEAIRALQDRHFLTVRSLDHLILDIV